jgi:hypothetical protein
VASTPVEEFVVAIGTKFDKAGFDKALQTAGQGVNTLAQKLAQGSGGRTSGSKTSAAAHALSGRVPGGSTIAAGISAAAEAGPIGAVFAGMALAALSVAAAASAMATGVAKSFEQLNFQANVAGGTASSLATLKSGFENVGLAADGAVKAAEGIGLALKYNPGTAGLLGSLGVEVVRDKNGLVDLAKTTDHLMDRLVQMNPVMAAAYGQLFGISPTDIENWRKFGKEIEAAQDRFTARAAAMGVDLDKLGTESHAFMDVWRNGWTNLELGVDRIAQVSLPGLTRALQVTDAFVENGVLGLIKLFHDWYDMEVALWNGIIATVSAAWGKAGQQATATLAVLGKGFSTLFGDIASGSAHGLAALESMFGPGFTAAVDAAEAYVQKFFNWFMNSDAVKLFRSLLGSGEAAAGKVGAAVGAAGSWVDHVIGRIGQQLHDRIGSDAVPAPATNGGVTGSVPSPGSASDPLGIRNNNPGNLRSGAGQIGSNQGFAVFRTAQEGLTALKNNLLNYARQGYDTISTIVNRWAPPSDNNPNNERYKATLARILGAGENQHLNLNDPAVLAGLIRGITQFENGKNPYSADLINSVAGMPAGAAGSRVAVNQQTTIHVNGATDPARTAAAVADHQRRVNADLTRHFSGAVLA